jgi:hypothetical protein
MLASRFKEAYLPSQRPKALRANGNDDEIAI